MAEQVKFDYSLTAGVISEDEMKAMEKITKDAKDVLVGKSGAGHYGGTHGKGQKSNCFILPTVKR